MEGIMFRPTPFTQSDLARSIVARETRSKVRYFDPKTARMSGWMPKPAQPTGPALGTLSVILKADASNFNRALYSSMPVAQLRKLASESGVKNASRMRKGDVIDALMAQPLSLAHA